MSQQLTPNERSYTDEQLDAIARRSGDLLLDASAGSGKTTVLVERFVRAVLDDGVEPGAILTITFTEKAAAELRERIRNRLREAGTPAQQEAAETAPIGTIHGFCARVLRAHALRAGLAPGFAVLDEPASEQLAGRAFDASLEAIAGHTPGGVELVAAYGVAGLREAIFATYAELRSRGELAPRLPELPPAPDGAAARRRLLAAASAVAAELAAAPDPGVRVRQSLERLQHVEALVAADALWPGALARVALPGGGGAALCTGACTAYSEALGALRAACEHRHAGDVRGLLDELLRGFGELYTAAKRRHGAVDFADLELLARELLGDSEIAAGYRERFTHVMVDEMQDTNRVQLGLIELVASGNLFTVGDAQQSIYGFRHADVELFERRGAELQARGARATLQTNFRSHPAILAELNAAFATAMGDRFRPLQPGRVEPGPTEPRVELLIADKGADWVGDSDALAAPWRLAEARALAARVAELVAGGVAPGEVVVLTRATTDLRAYERALESAGVPTYLIGGRGYWAHPQVIDVIAHLRTLANPRDEPALLTVLASPFVGVSLDALVILWAAVRRTGRAALELLGEPGGALAELAGPELDRLRRYAGWFAGERARVGRVGTTELIERAVADTGYDLAVLALPGGQRRMANIRKLMRLAHEHELGEGPDLRAFLELASRRATGSGARESEAPVESEGLDAVRLMTIHRAKGLEFPVVCVADLGRAPIRWPRLMRVGADGRFGVRLREPGSGRAEPALDYAALADAEQRAEQEEERRLFYVAMTRAQERLILSGAAKLTAIPADRTPIGWIAPAFVPDIAARSEQSAGVSGGVAYRLMRPDDAPAPFAAAVPAPAAVVPALAPPAVSAPPAVAPASAPPAPAAAPAPPASLSYSALADYERCGYRFYVERVLGLRDPGTPPEPLGGPGSGLAAADRGTLVHALLERLDFRHPRPPDAAAVAAAAPTPLRTRDAEAIAGLLAGFAAGELSRRLGRAGSVRREERFAFSLGGMLMTGAVDVLAREPGGRLLIVDYKTDALGGRDPAPVADGRYRLQRTVYALAGLRTGAAAVEVAYVFLERPDETVLQSFTPDEIPALEAAVSARAAGILSRRFPVAEVPQRSLCDGCPARDGLCSWPAAMTGREAPDRLF